MRPILFLLLLPGLLNAQKIKPVVIARLPQNIPSSSGIAASANTTVWTFNDNRGGPILYEISLDGKFDTSHIELVASKTDWEDITGDSTRLYVGDFGNNLNRRKNLVIFFVPKKGIVQSEFGSIRFHYPDQKQFPPPPSNWNFDCEAFLHQGNSLYLFSKNLSNPNDGYAKMYRLPNESGDYPAELIDSVYLNEPVTSAGISPDGKTVVLLTYFSLWVLKDFPGNNFFEGKVFQFPFRRFTQKEAICFANDHELFITDERRLGKGGKLYKIDLNELNFSQPTKKFKSQFCKRAIYNALNNPKARYRKIMKREAVQ